MADCNSLKSTPHCCAINISAPSVLLPTRHVERRAKQREDSTYNIGSVQFDAIRVIVYEIRNSVDVKHKETSNTIALPIQAAVLYNKLLHRRSHAAIARACTFANVGERGLIIVFASEEALHNCHSVLSQSSSLVRAEFRGITHCFTS